MIGRKCQTLALGILLGVLLLCCHNEQSKIHQSKPNDSGKSSSATGLVMGDSLRFEAAMSEAFKIAKEQFLKDTFRSTFVFHPGDSSYEIENQIEIGRIFGDENKYFLLRRNAPFLTLINIYRLDSANTTQVIFHEQGGMTYIEDMISDVNGDGFRDFLVHWYPASGCCRRDIYSVYVYLPNVKAFSSELEFINPTFFPKEGMVLGVGYGHPGEVGLYKYKWKGIQIDTVEYIYPHPDNRDQFIKTKKPIYKTDLTDRLILHEVPLEYREIESYEWFADY